MKPYFSSRLRWLPLTALLLGQAMVTSAHAQPQSPSGPATNRTVAPVELAPAAALPDHRGPHAAPATAAASAPAEPRLARSIDIGGATEGLLAMQRASVSAHARNIDGEQAGRSYQRYLKSFETTIPEHYNTGLGLAKK